MYLNKNNYEKLHASKIIYIFNSQHIEYIINYVEKMKNRLIEFLKYLGIGQDKFAKNVGLSRGYVNNIGDNITMKTVDKIVKAYPELNKGWLLTGDGKMLNENCLENIPPEQEKKSPIDCVLQGQLEHDFKDFITASIETNRINAESFLKIADSHNILTNSHNTLINNQDKLLDIFKTLSTDNNAKIDILIEKLNRFMDLAQNIQSPEKNEA